MRKGMITSGIAAVALASLGTLAGLGGGVASAAHCQRYPMEEQITHVIDVGLYPRNPVAADVCLYSDLTHTYSTGISIADKPGYGISIEVLLNGLRIP
jgi:hypothetical protein